MATSALATAAPNHEAQGAAQTHRTVSSVGCGACWVALSPGLLSRSALGYSTTWSPKVPTDTYSFSSGPWLGSGSSELLGLMARSAEQPEKG